MILSNNERRERIATAIFAARVADYRELQDYKEIAQDSVEAAEALMIALAVVDSLGEALMAKHSKNCAITRGTGLTCTDDCIYKGA
jgi:hypothetical protein